MNHENFYKNKKILITGHTGFKGSWLALILTKMGASILGYALEPDKNVPNLYSILKLANSINSVIADIRNYNILEAAILKFKPDIIFHLAAQPLVRESYDNPVYNFETNVIGTVNLLNIGLRCPNLKAVINITTDKCYENKEWSWPYRESDRLGGHDPYSASKACSEIVTNSYRLSYYEDRKIGLASARAGNVIGGGDFSKDRIIPDIVRSIENNNKVILRNPKAIRPWQHVFDVLNGYLILGQKLYLQPKLYSEAYNFSPIDSSICEEVTVETIVQNFIDFIGRGEYEIKLNQANYHEAQMLKLDSSKAVKYLGWQPKYNASQAILKTANWYKEYLTASNIKEISESLVNNYFAFDDALSDGEVNVNFF